MQTLKLPPPLLEQPPSPELQLPAELNPPRAPKSGPPVFANAIEPDVSQLFAIDPDVSLLLAIDPDVSLCLLLETKLPNIFALKPNATIKLPFFLLIK